MKVDMPSPPETTPSYGIIEKTDDVTPIVLRAMSGAPNDRLREVMTAFVRHLHAFAREVRLTQDEYDLAIDFLNRTGKATTDTHNEGILFADAVGLSTLVVLMNNGGKGPTETAAALLGPFWRDNSPLTPNGGSIVRSPTPGPELFANLRVTDPDGRPIQGVEVDVWQASPVGFYENQDPEQADMNLRGRFYTDENGKSWRLRSLLKNGGLLSRRDCTIPGSSCLATFMEKYNPTAGWTSIQKVSPVRSPNTLYTI